MINIIYSEFIKLKRSFALLLNLLAAIVLPVIMLSVWRMQGKTVKWAKYAMNGECMMFMMLCPILFPLISGYIFSREYTDKTANITYTYANHKLKVFVGKLVAVFLIIFAVYLINFVAIYISGFFLKHDSITKDFLLLHLKLYGESLMLQFALTPIVIAIANLSKNIIVPVIYGVIAVVSNMCIISTGKYMNSPFMLPVIPFMDLHGAQGILGSETILIGLGVFIIGFVGCMVYYLRADIN